MITGPLRFIGREPHRKEKGQEGQSTGRESLAILDNSLGWGRRGEGGAVRGRPLLMRGRTPVMMLGTSLVGRVAVAGGGGEGGRGPGQRQGRRGGRGAG